MHIHLPAPAPVASGPKFLVPFPHNPDFVGRDEDLASLHALVQQGIVGIKPTVLVGLGGIGKTQLAVEYAHAHREDYPGGVFWLNAVNLLLLEFASLAEQLGLAAKETPRDEAVKRAWGYLDNHPDSLVIFDNVIEAADLNIPIAPGLIPANLRCRTLFTTRQRDFPRNFQPFEVKVLPEMAAMHLLLRPRPEVLEEHHPEWGMARIVCASLGWLPLALELAAAYLGEYPEVTLHGYLERLRTEGKLSTVDDTELRPDELPTRHDIAVAATLQTQWSRLDDEDARMLFRAAGQFPEATWIPIARLGVLTAVKAEADPGHAAPLTRALMKLHTVSLIEELTGERLRLHPLVQEFAAKLSPGTFRAEMAGRVADEFRELQNLEAHVIQRGVYEVLEDLRTGLGLCLNDGEDNQTYAQLNQLERILGRETHHLQHWKPGPQPYFFLQKFCNSCVELNLGDWQTRAEALLAERKWSYLRGGLQTSREPEALIRTLVGHTSEVRGVAVTPDGRFAVSASFDKTLKVWDLQSGQLVRTLEVHTNDVTNFVSYGVHGVAVTPDGRFAISALQDRTLKVWDLQSGQLVRTLEGHTNQVRGVAVTPDGRFAVSASFDDTLKVWDLPSGQLIHTLEGHTKAVIGVAVTPDGRLAVSASGDKTLKVWDLQSNFQLVHTLEGHAKAVFGVAVTPDGCFAISASEDDTLKVWDLPSGQLIRTLEGHTNQVFGVAVTPDGRFAVSASLDKTLKVWDLRSGQLVRTLKGYATWVNGVAVTPDGRLAVSASGDTLKVWDLQQQPHSDQLDRMLKGHTLGVNAVAVTRDGRFAVSASEDDTLKVWDLQHSGRLVRTLEGHSSVSGVHGVHGVIMTPDGRFAISASGDNTLKVWDLRHSGQLVRTLEGHTSGVTGVAVTPDGRFAISASRDKTLKVWDLRSGQLIRTLEGHDSYVFAVAVTPNGRFAISASNILKVWDLQQNCQLIRTLEGHTSWVKAVAVTPDGRFAVSASVDKSLKVWDLHSGQLVRTLEGHTERVGGVAVTPDGRFAVSASEDKTLKIWDLPTGQSALELVTEVQLSCCAIVQDGRMIVAGDLKGGVHFVEWVRWD